LTVAVTLLLVGTLFLASLSKAPQRFLASPSKAPQRFFPSWGRHWDVQSENHGRELGVHYANLIYEYQAELHEEMASVKKKREDPRYVELRKQGDCFGQIGTIEASMLFILIRIVRPRRVLEVGSLCGTSTRWILSALERNGGEGVLESFDLRNKVDQLIVENRDRWVFRQQNIEAYATENPDALQNVDLIFIDALHLNSFAKMYTTKILAPLKQTIPVVIHDIYNPMMIPKFRHCNQYSRVSTYEQEIECIQQAVDAWKKEQHGRDDFFYSRSQTSGEGQELLSWLARTSRTSSPIVTFHPHAAPRLGTLLHEAMVRAHLSPPGGDRNNPAVFFLLTGANA